MLRYLAVSALALLLCATLTERSHAEWIEDSEEDHEGSKCALITGAGFQEAGEFRRDRATITLRIKSYEPLALRFELDSGIQSSLRTVGVIKIDEAIFVMSFDGRIGVLKDQTESEALVQSLRLGKRLSAGYRNSGKTIFGGFPIEHLDKALEDLRRSCPFLG